MTDRKELLDAVAELADDFPHLRLGQLLQNALDAANVSTPLYYVKDGDLFAAVTAYDPEDA